MKKKSILKLCRNSGKTPEISAIKNKIALPEKENMQIWVASVRWSTRCVTLKSMFSSVKSKK